MPDKMLYDVEKHDLKRSNRRQIARHYWTRCSPSLFLMSGENGKSFVVWLSRYSPIGNCHRSLLKRREKKRPILFLSRSSLSKIFLLWTLIFNLDVYLIRNKHSSRFFLLTSSRLLPTHFLLYLSSTFSSDEHNQWLLTCPEDKSSSSSTDNDKDTLDQQLFSNVFVFVVHSTFKQQQILLVYAILFSPSSLYHHLHRSSSNSKFNYRPISFTCRITWWSSTNTSDEFHEDKIRFGYGQWTRKTCNGIFYLSSRWLSLLHSWSSTSFYEKCPTLHWSTTLTVYNQSE